MGCCRGWEGIFTAGYADVLLACWCKAKIKSESNWRLCCFYLFMYADEWLCCCRRNSCQYFISVCFQHSFCVMSYLINAMKGLIYINEWQVTISGICPSVDCPWPPEKLTVDCSPPLCSLKNPSLKWTWMIVRKAIWLPSIYNPALNSVFLPSDLWLTWACSGRCSKQNCAHKPSRTL